MGRHRKIHLKFIKIYIVIYIIKIINRSDDKIKEKYDKIMQYKMVDIILLKSGDIRIKVW